MPERVLARGRDGKRAVSKLVREMLMQVVTDKVQSSTTRPNHDLWQYSVQLVRSNFLCKVGCVEIRKLRQIGGLSLLVVYLIVADIECASYPL
jgi:hypothetical protein